MAKERIFELQQNKGTFQLKGIVTGTDKDSFYTEGKTSTGKDKRKVSFGIAVSDNETIYVGIEAFPQKSVYFSTRVEENGKKVNKTTEVEWAKRMSFNKEGYTLIGMNIGLEKIADEKGNMKNDNKHLTEFDACKYISEKLEDGMSVYIRGSIEYSSYTDDKGNVRHITKLKPSQISLTKDIDFEKDERVTDFEQEMIYMGIEQEMEHDAPTGRGIISAKVVNYATIEDVEFICEDPMLCKGLKTQIKPYTAMKINGTIKQTVGTEETETKSIWGTKSKIGKINTPAKREIIMTGADEDSFDVETYTKKNIAEAEAKIEQSKNASNDFGNVTEENPWGTSSKVSADTDETDPWA